MYIVNHGCLSTRPAPVTKSTPPAGSVGPGDTPKLTADQAGLGPALRRAWIGYQRRLDQEMAAAGFADRRFPDGRVLRMCSGPGETTVSEIGRELGITRQGASKIVAALRDRRYLTLSPSATDGREKIVKATPRAVEYLATQREAARSIERQLGTELGTEALTGLKRLLEVLGDSEDVRMSDYLREKRRGSGVPDTAE